MATPIPANAACFTLDELVQATGGRLDGGGSTASEVRSVVIDSRAVTNGSLFVALRGEQHDAHRFVPQALSAGAGALLVAEDAEIDAGDVPVIRVPDTTTALGDIAAAHRLRWGRPVVAVTGSAGKTSSKELIAAALGALGHRVHKTEGNLNNLIGVPMTLLCLDEDSNVAVIEMGTSEPGEIRRLGDIGRPDIAVVTLVSAAHTEGLGDLAAVADEKWSLVEALHPAGVAVVNGDDGSLARLVREHSASRVVFFGTDAHCDVRLESFAFDAQLETVAAFEVRDHGRLEVRLSLLGEAAAFNAGAALAVAFARGEDVARAAEGLPAVDPAPGRMSPIIGGRYAILDDSYNANPRSTELALETARAFADARHSNYVAVLADMGELGARSREEHEAVGRLAIRRGAHGVVFVGEEMTAARDAARQERGDERGIVHVADAADAVAPVRALAADGDVVLVKGSRSMRTERVVEALMREEAQ